MSKNETAVSMAGIFISSFVNYTFSFVFPLLSLVLLKMGKLSEKEVGWMMAGGFLLSGLLQSYVGALLDRGRDKLVLVSAAVASLVGIAGLACAGSSPLLIIIAFTFFLTGFNTISTVTSLFIEGLATAESRGHTSLLFASVASLGFFLSSVLAFYFLDRFPNWLLAFDAISTLILCSSLLLHSKRLRRSESRKADIPKFLFFENFRSKPRLTLGTFLVFVAKVACLSIIPLVYVQSGEKGGEFAIVMFAANDLTVFALGLFATVKINKLSTRTQLFCFMILSAAGLGLVPFVRGQPTNILATLLWSVAEVFSYPALSRLTFGSFADGEAGRAAGLKSLLLRFAMAATPAVAALVLGINNISISLILMAIPIVGTVLLIVQERRQ